MSSVSTAAGWLGRVSGWVGTYRNVTWLAVIVGGGAVFLYRVGASRGPAVFWGTVLLVASLAVLLGAGLILRRATRPDYRWLSADYTYQFDPADLRRQTQSIRVKIKANRDNVELFQNSYYWTGDGTSEVRVLSHGHRLVCETQAKDSERRRYYVHLETPLSRNQEAEIRIEQDLFDERAEFRPILAKKVSEPLDKLTLTVVFPRQHTPRTMAARQMKQVRDDTAQWSHVRDDQVEWTNNATTTEAEYSPVAPQTGRRYEIEWTPWENYPKSDVAT